MATFLFQADAQAELNLARCERDAFNAQVVSTLGVLQLHPEYVSLYCGGVLGLCSDAVLMRSWGFTASRVRMLQNMCTLPCLADAVGGVT